MDLKEVAQLSSYTMLSSVKFPYDSGQLHDNFISNEFSTTNSYGFTLMENPEIYYGKILEVAPSIRYKIKRNTKYKGFKYDYVKHPNKHFRYIERIIEEDVIPELENEYGVRKI